MFVIHHISIAPVLAAFHENYWRASRMAAEYLVENVERGETVFAVSDIGMLTYYSHDRYRVIDAPGLVDPSFAGLSLSDALRRTRARFVVEHYGSTKADTFDVSPGLVYERALAVPFVAPGLVSADSQFTLNVFRARGLDER